MIRESQGLETYYKQAFQAGYFDRLEGNTAVFDISAADRYNFPELTFIKEIRVTCGPDNVVRVARVPRITRRTALLQGRISRENKLVNHGQAFRKALEIIK